ncbi:MAG: hypothetical protein ACR2OX_02920, partial [Methyloligellaceae bacterium]
MSTSIEGTGIEMKPTTLPKNDGTKNQASKPADAAASGEQAGAANQPDPTQPQTGLPGLAGFAQTNTFAAPSAPEPVAPPPVEPPAAPIEQQQPVVDLPPVTDLQPVSEPDPAAFAQQPIEPAPVEPAPIEAAPFEAEPIEPAPIEATPLDTQIPEFIPTQAPENDIIATDVPDLNSLADPVAPGEAAPELQADDDLNAFSADALERYFAGEGEIPGTDADVFRADDGLASQDLGLDPVEPAISGDGPLETPEVPDLSTGVQPFEARYDQHPEVPLGDFDEGLKPTGSYQTEAEDLTPPDADFLEGDSFEPEAPAVKAPKNRKVAMVASALVGSLALGGALAFAYKNSGLIMGGSGDAPLIQADNSPTKVAPDDPGGKQFPHKNKLIYDRLQGDETPEVEKIVPRQEEVASNTAAAAGTPNAAPNAQPGAEGPKKVKTLIVKPDGTVMQSENAAGPGGTQVAAANPQTPPAAVAPQPALPNPAAAPATPPEGTAASIEAPARKPALDNPQTQTAAVATAPEPAAAPAAGGEQFVVQVAARKSQTAALAAFADLQQRYPSLLN